MINDMLFTYEFSSKDMGVDLDSEGVDDVEVGVEALGESLRQVFLEGHMQTCIGIYRLLQLLQAIAQVCPFASSLEERVDGLKL